MKKQMNKKAPEFYSEWWSDDLVDTVSSVILSWQALLGQLML